MNIAPIKPLPSRELGEILNHAKSEFLELKKKKIFITGGTGFIGKWLTQSLIAAHERFELDLELVLLTRSVPASLVTSPWLRQNYIRFIEGDVRSFQFPEDKFDVVIHGAVAASAKLNAENPEEMLRTCTEGTFHTLKFAEKCATKKVLMLSSGAVYGKQPADITHINEAMPFGPDILNPSYAYHEGKRTSELMGAIWSKKTGGEFKVARCFAFVGPYLPLDTHFAVGNFILDCLSHRTVQIKGDGTNYRSLMYGTDLIVWLLKILVQGESCRAYNVGSDYDLSIKEMAILIDRIGAEFFPTRAGLQERLLVHGKPVPGAPIERYVPSVERVHRELGVKAAVNLEEALRRTFKWYGNEA